MDAPAGRSKPPPTSRTRAREGTRPKRAKRLPDVIAVACPPGTRAAVERFAEWRGETPADFLRRTLKLRLEVMRGRMRRERAKGSPK